MTDKEMLLYNSLKGLHLLDKTDAHTVVSDLMGLQAQFANYPKASLQIRAPICRLACWCPVSISWSWGTKIGSG